MNQLVSLLKTTSNYRLLALPELPSSLRFIVVMQGSIAASDQRLKISSWEALLKDGEVYLRSHRDELQTCIESIKPDDLATIVYTSGTTGLPKGVMLLHRNLYGVCKAISLHIGFHADDLSLSFLPLAHVFERVCGQFVAVYEGLVTAYAESMETVGRKIWRK